MADELGELKARVGMETPSLDELLEYVSRPQPEVDRMETAS